ncbi:glycosyltransferase family 4 protein [Patescibacteria group bacterium]|nr:glycosyltransferase family 4 protein [Patescibacteria group bacterium]MBU0776938.1 glycosyltransferase family 4 protein [Patescibacteria group bacterium]MBU0923222.1 glycosyltransferase family 4 protein [Patescibacteria group bacterium]MBU1066909.1 glycosyltransferase family 4 protein [Patescibacteria group bacterium]MBU1844673.1 glycosyltransferase family 4 protein [Patescibacteria group bacterium]
MKIGIDISQIVYGTGVSTYTRNLIKALLSLDKDSDYVVFGGSLRRRNELEAFLTGLKGNVSGKVYPFPPTMADILWNRLHVLRIEKLVGDLDVFHSSDWTQPPSNAFKVTTIHDLVPLRFPQYSHPRIVSAHKARLKHIKREIDVVIVPSDASKEDLMVNGVSEDRIRVIPEAADPIYKPAEKKEIEKLKRSHRIKEGYILAVGVGPRKNTERIIEAYEKVRAGRNLKLIILGHPYKRIEQKSGVIFTGQVDISKMPTYYSGAEALVYPTIYEGFGLPVLEAFSCKTPVVTSNTSSLPEVAGDAAEIVDPFDVNSITEGIKNALNRKKGLISKGLERSKDFSWEKTAEMTLEVYNEAKK